MDIRFISGIEVSIIGVGEIYLLYKYLKRKLKFSAGFSKFHFFVENFISKSPIMGIQFFCFCFGKYGPYDFL